MNTNASCINDIAAGAFCNKHLSIIAQFREDAFTDETIEATDEADSIGRLKQLDGSAVHR